MDVLDWVEQALDTPGINLSPITPQKVAPINLFIARFLIYIR
jgi:hypothetical protein